VTQAQDRRRPLRYVALGDSYTIGTSVAVAERWPDQLVARLRGGPLDLVANLAVNGYTSRDVIERELPKWRELEPEFTSLLIGVNDVVQGFGVPTYEQNVRAILDELGRRVAADRTLIVSTPDYTVTPEGASYGDPAERRAGIDAVNRAMARVAAERGVSFVDVTDLSRLAADDASLVAMDGLHPSGTQYARWVDRILPVVEERLAL
jgi:lysophospholipase L1-like esterase